MCKEYGLDIEYIIEMFDDMYLCSGLDHPITIAHNLLYDRMVINHNAHFNVCWPEKQICTMKRYRNRVKAKDKNGRIKNPTLDELYEYAFGKKREKSHDAWIDTVDLAACYFEIEGRK